MLLAAPIFDMGFLPKQAAALASSTYSTGTTTTTTSSSSSDSLLFGTTSLSPPLTGSRYRYHHQRSTVRPRRIINMSSAQSASKALQSIAAFSSAASPEYFHDVPRLGENNKGHDEEDEEEEHGGSSLFSLSLADETSTIMSALDGSVLEDLPRQQVRGCATPRTVVEIPRCLITPLSKHRASQIAKPTPSPKKLRSSESRLTPESPTTSHIATPAPMPSPAAKNTLKRGRDEDDEPEQQSPRNTKRARLPTSLLHVSTPPNNPDTERLLQEEVQHAPIRGYSCQTPATCTRVEKALADKLQHAPTPARGYL